MTSMKYTEQDYYTTKKITGSWLLMANLQKSTQKNFLCKNII